MFARSTDHGQIFSKPMIISKNVPNAQGSDIAVAPDGTIYVVWRQLPFVGTSNAGNGIVYVKSTDGGHVHELRRSPSQLTPTIGLTCT